MSERWSNSTLRINNAMSAKKSSRKTKRRSNRDQLRWNEMERRLTVLESHLSAFIKLEMLNVAQEKFAEARFTALLSLSMELAEKAGVPRCEFMERYNERSRHWHAWLLEKVEEVCPEMAAKIDIRPIEWCGSKPDYSPLFDRPSA